ncbi:hypothetical protein QUA80_11425 [Microcoleus sp. F4-D5]
MKFARAWLFPKLGMQSLSKIKNLKMLCNPLGLAPGNSLYGRGVRVRKNQPIAGFDIACKWKRNYQRLKVKDAWFILTEGGSLSVAIAAYKQRMGIEEMFRDCKSGDTI